MAPALQFIFKINYIPQKEDFKELTPAQYASFHRQGLEEEFGDIRRKRLLAFLPDEIAVYNRIVDLFGDQLVIISEDEFIAFIKAGECIDMICEQSGKSFENLTDKLSYMAKTMPSVFTEGTPYALHRKLKNRK